MVKPVNDRQPDRGATTRDGAARDLEERVDLGFATASMRATPKVEPVTKGKGLGAAPSSALEEGAEAKTRAAKKVTGDAPVLEKFVPGAMTIQLNQPIGLEGAKTEAEISGQTGQRDPLSRANINLDQETAIATGRDVLALLRARCLAQGAQLGVVPSAAPDGADRQLSPDVSKFTLGVRVPNLLRRAESKLEENGNVMVLAS